MLHAWDCSCGTRNAPQFAECRKCRLPQSRGRAVYDAPTVAPFATLGQRPWFHPRWLLGGAAALAFALIVSRMPAGRDPARESAAQAMFRSSLQQAADTAPGILLSVGVGPLGNPVVTVSDDWYAAPVVEQRRLVEAVARRWQSGLQQAGVAETNRGVELQDRTGRKVAAYSPLWGVTLEKD